MKVIFRKFKAEGDIIAFFPELEANKYKTVCYQHVGQHGEADYHELLSITVPATLDEYAPLAKELAAIYGEPLDVVARMQRK